MTADYEGEGWREGGRVITKYCSVNLTTHRVPAHKIVFIHQGNKAWQGRGGGVACLVTASHHVTRVILELWWLFCYISWLNQEQDQVRSGDGKDLNLSQLLCDNWTTVIFKLSKIPRGHQRVVSLDWLCHIQLSPMEYKMDQRYKHQHGIFSNLIACCERLYNLFGFLINWERLLFRG